MKRFGFYLLAAQGLVLCASFCADTEQMERTSRAETAERCAAVRRTCEENCRGMGGQVQLVITDELCSTYVHTAMGEFMFCACGHFGETP